MERSATPRLESFLPQGTLLAAEFSRGSERFCTSLMERNLTLLELDRVLELVCLEARSEPGRACVRALRPHASLEDAERAQTLLWEMVRLVSRDGTPPLQGLIDPDPLLAAADFGVPEAWEIVRSVSATQAVRESLTRTELAVPHLRALGEQIPRLDELLREVGRYFTREGRLREDASPLLRSLRQKIVARRNAIQKNLGELMNRHEDAVQDTIITVRGDRYCIPVRSDRRQEIPGILHERSGSGASLFVEPLVVVEANNELTDLLLQEREEIVRLVRQIASSILRESESIREAVAIAAEVDCLAALASFSGLAEATRPKLSNERELRIIDARHPLLDQRLAAARREALGDESDIRVVPTTFTVPAGVSALIVSGPNAGGKTVALKTAGLLAVMAASGLPVPAAEGTTIPFFDEVHVLIGDDQDVMQHLSTFSAYLVRLKRILEHASAKSLVLLDELGSGTDPEEGAALAAAVVEELAERGSLLLVTTHLTALKTFATGDVRVANASMEFDPESGRPTFRLLEGLPGRSRAIEAARLVGLPSQVIDAARARLGEEYGRLDRMVGELQSSIAAAREREKELTALLAQAERREREAERARVQYEKEQTELRKRFRDETVKLRDDVQERLHGELRKLREADESTRKKVTSTSLAREIVVPVAEEEEAPVELKAGDEIEHRRFKLRGTVTAVKGDRVEVKSGGKSVEFPSADFRLLRRAGSGAAAESRPKRETAVATADDEPASAELNLVGWRVDEAIEESDRFIDRSLLEGRKAVRLIHGYGTGTLRRAIREWLRTHKGVRSFRPGDEHEGGDGATIAILDVS